MPARPARAKPRSAKAPTAVKRAAAQVAKTVPKATVRKAPASKPRTKGPTKPAERTAKSATAIPLEPVLAPVLAPVAIPVDVIAPVAETRHRSAPLIPAVAVTEARGPGARPAVVLTFAGTDPTSGAGVQADLLTLASLGCHAVSVVTAVTVQDTAGVSRVVPMSAELVTAQANAIFNDMTVAVVKIGFIGSAENAVAIGAILADHPRIPVVLDPVLASGRGDLLADDALLDAMRRFVLPYATVVTPNSLEARRLADDPDAPLADCATAMLERGAHTVLITGTHENTTEVANRLYGERGEIRADAWTRLEGSFHGSGCTLASAIAALLANGLGLAEAVGEAQEYTWQTLAHGLRPGRGQSIPDRFFWARHAEVAAALSL